MKQKIGLLVDSTEVSKQIKDLLELSLSAHNYEITTLIINHKDPYPGNIVKKFFAYTQRRGFLRYFIVKKRIDCSKR